MSYPPHGAGYPPGGAADNSSFQNIPNPYAAPPSANPFPPPPSQAPYAPPPMGNPYMQEQHPGGSSHPAPTPPNNPYWPSQPPAGGPGASYPPPQHHPPVPAPHPPWSQDRPQGGYSSPPRRADFPPKPEVMEVRPSTFPLRTGCRVTLFQSAHIGDFRLPPLTLYGMTNTLPQHGAAKHTKPLQPWQVEDNNDQVPRPFPIRNCWEELFVAILEAKHFIYITGWSVWTELRLLRQRPVEVEDYPGLPMNITVGELLKMKAQEGVGVCMLVWQEATSVEVGGVVSHAGMVGTFSGQTTAYFRGTGVECKAVMRRGDLGDGLAFTHHQKSIIMDSPALGGMPGQRRVVAFMGGLDITSGRWDNPEKSLFSTLNTYHRDDFYNGCVPGVDVLTGPRQPWQDIHAKLEGAVAWDVARNFESRWRTEPTCDDRYLRGGFENTPGLVRDDTVIPPGDHEEWHVQFFRSIDSFSDSWVDIERGIHDAYSCAITASTRFIYIENQYFMGGSDLWDDASKKASANNFFDKLAKLVGKDDYRPKNRVPVMLVERIERAIQEGKPFCVYVTIPLHPEGNPSDIAMQEIMAFQYKTIKMMYRRIADALRRAGSRAHPCDYLNIFCLGNKEPGTPVQLPTNPRHAEVVRNRRMMIYVHSKMMIVDDDYVIVGSANINDRSLAGDRDTEIAFGAYQPKHSGTTPDGVVSCFRKMLWAEHLGHYDTFPEVLERPETRECTIYMVRRAQAAWDEHISGAPTQQCHLMRYPLLVDPDGNVGPIPGQEFIPDTNMLARVAGKESDLMPDFMTS